MVKVVASSAPAELTAEDLLQDLSGPWQTVVWNDPVNLMSYVTYIFQTYFGYSPERAHELMWQVHTEGKAIVSSGTKERMERDVAAMHKAGLWATLQEV